jgi:hypothetical protein
MYEIIQNLVRSSLPPLKMLTLVREITAGFVERVQNHKYKCVKMLNHALLKHAVPAAITVLQSERSCYIIGLIKFQ